MRNYQKNQKVYWWRYISKGIEYPYLAEILSIGEKSIKILVDDPVDNEKVIRHVKPIKLQPIASYFSKIHNQGPLNYGLTESWGIFTRYFEVGDDLRSLRHIDVYENGNMLAYDREHWVDDFGMLADAQINRNEKNTLFGLSKEISAEEFITVWNDARNSKQWELQKNSSHMNQMGKSPIWFSVKHWMPKKLKK